MRGLAIGCVLLAAGSVRAGGPPSGLTAKRTAQGIFLAWTGSPTGRFAVWRGPDASSLVRLATLAPDQHGFLDLNVRRAETYRYALGSETSPGAAITVDGIPAVAVKAYPSLVTVCSGLTRGKNFPANTQNAFTLGKDATVQFFGYFLLKPWDPAPHLAKLVWRDAKGEVFSEYAHEIAPRQVTLTGESAGSIALAQAVGLSTVIVQNGQRRAPSEPGQCTVEAWLDDAQISESLFYLQGSASKPAAPAPAVPGLPTALAP